jgi:hypothetical protein
MTYVQRASRQFAVRQAVRKMAVDTAVRQRHIAAEAAAAAAGAPPPMREPTEFETPLSPAEIEQGVRDGTFAAPPPGKLSAKRRDMRAGRGGGYVTKEGPGDDDLDEDDTGFAPLP